MSGLKHIKVFEAGKGIYSGKLTSIATDALENKKKTIAFKILEYIHQSGEMGRSHTEIITFIIERLKGGKYNYQTDRGHYATNLYGSWMRPGLYPIYCEKAEGGRWKLNSETAEFFDNYEGLGGFSKDLRNILSRL